MAVAVTLLTSGSGGSSTDPHVTASVSPSDDATMLLCVTNRDVGGAPNPTVTGGSLTWTEIAEVHHDQAGTNSFMYIFRAETGSSPGSFTVSIAYGTAPAVGNIWQVVEITETDLTTDNGLVQFNTAFVDGTNTTETTTFGSTPATNGIIFSFCSIQDSSEETFTVDSGFTLLKEQDVANQEQLATQYEIGGSPDTGVAAEWSGSGGPIGMISLEIKAGGQSETTTAIMNGGGSIAATAAKFENQVLRPASTITAGAWDSGPSTGQPLHEYAGDDSDATFIEDTTV